MANGSGKWKSVVLMLLVMGILCSIARRALIWEGMVTYHPVMRITESWTINDPCANMPGWLAILAEVVGGGVIAFMFCMLFTNPRKYRVEGLGKCAWSGVLSGAIGAGVLAHYGAEGIWFLVGVVVVGVAVGTLVGCGHYAHCDLYRAFGATAAVIELAFLRHGGLLALCVFVPLVVANVVASAFGYFVLGTTGRCFYALLRRRHS